MSDTIVKFKDILETPEAKSLSDQIKKIINEFEESEEEIKIEMDTDDIAKTKLIPYIAVDNDECIGSWGDLSLVYSFIKKNISTSPSVKMFAEIIEETQCIRPYVRHLFDALLLLKDSNCIGKIYMFTAASNVTGWVAFLKDVLEEWYGRPIYDGLIDGNEIINWNLNRGIPSVRTGTIKDMCMIRSKHSLHPYHPVIIIDDRPENVINGEGIKIKPYMVAVNVIEVIKKFMPEHLHLTVSYSEILQSSWNKYQVSSEKFTNVSLDIDMLNIVEYLYKKLL